METSLCAIVEFQRSSAPGVGRLIRFNHSAEHMPYQLKGRVSQATWESFMCDVDVLAKEHPYVQRPGAGDIGKWGICTLVGSVMGVCCMNPDSGSYPDWCESVSRVIARYQREFGQGGCSMSLQKGVNYYLRIDIDPNVDLVDFEGSAAPIRNKGDSSSYISPFQSLPSGLKAMMSEEHDKEEDNRLE
jgi:hypothetical protein